MMDDSSQAALDTLPPFLTKTYGMVDDPSTNRIISWSVSNRSFIVWNPPEFMKELLPKCFRHSNFSSFIRQLNTYGFRKIDPARWEFANDDFIKGRRDLLKNIQSRKIIHNHSLQVIQELRRSSSLALTGCEKQRLEKEIEKLKQEKSLLLHELQRQTNEHQEIKHRMQSLEDRLSRMEHRQLGFFAQIMEKPEYVFDVINKRRRLLSSTDNHYKVMTMHILNNNNGHAYDQDKMSETGMSLGDDLGSTDQIMTSFFENQPSKFPRSIPHGGDICSSTELVQSIKDAEFPIISALQLNKGIRGISWDIGVSSSKQGEAGDNGVEAWKEQAVEVGTSRSLSVETGVNDVFWKQLLTKTLESCDIEKFLTENTSSSSFDEEEFPSPCSV